MTKTPTNEATAALAAPTSAQEPTNSPQYHADTQRQVVNRLKRAHGQLAGVIAAVERGESCRDVITQLSAASTAIDRAGFLMISAAMRECMANPAVTFPDEPAPGSTPAHSTGLTLDELERLFLRLA